MANPESYPREAYLKITSKGTAGYIEMRENNSSFLIDYELSFSENFPKVLTVVLDNANIVSTVNILNSSCARWSGGITGALKQGDIVKFGFYRTGTSTIDYYFDGTVKELKPGENGRLTVVCKDRLDRLDHIKRDTIIYNKYKKKTKWSITYENGYRRLNNFTDTDVVYPFEYLAYCSALHTEEYGAGVLGGGSGILDLGLSLNNRVAQSFIATGHMISHIYCEFSLNTYGPGGGGPSYDITCNVHRDNGNSPGAIFGSDMKFRGLETGNGQWIGTFDVNTPAPLLAPGEKYWIVFKATVVAGNCIIQGNAPGTTYKEDAQKSTDGGVTWSKVTGPPHLQLHCKMTQYDFQELEPNQYYFDDTNNIVWLYGDLNIAADIAMISYFQLYISLEDVFKALIKMNTFMLGNVNAYIDFLLKTYSTQGKTVGDCMRELCNIFETTAPWTGLQHAMAHYVDANGINRCKVGFRMNTTYTEVLTASFPEDRPSNTDEYIIVGEPRLQKTDRYKYSEVIVVGQDIPTGRPLICCRSDKALSSSYWKKVDGQIGTMKVSRPDLCDLGMVNAEAYRLLDAVSRDLWEGSISLSGHHLVCWSTDPTQDDYGAGRLIKLYWSPMGISAVKFKITQMVITPTRTEIFVNNVDPLLTNYVTQSFGALGRLDSYMAPVGLVDNIYIETYSDSVITSDHNVYMKLYDENNVVLTSHDQALCIRFDSPNYNAITYHAEFEKGNGYSDQLVRYVELNTIEHGQLAKIDLRRTTSSIEIDERARKTDTNRLIVELTAKRA